MITPEDPTERAAEQTQGGTGGDVVVADAVLDPDLDPETRPPHPTLPRPDPGAVPEVSDGSEESEQSEPSEQSRDPEGAEASGVTDSTDDSDSSEDPDGAASRLWPHVYVARALRSWGRRTVQKVRHPTPGLLLSLVYVVFAGYICHGLLFDPRSGILKDNGYDQQYFEWQLEWVKHALATFQNPLYSHTMNAPVGINVMANPQVLGPAVALAPVTALFGPAAAFMLLTLGNLALSAITWRWFLRRNVVRSEAAAFVAGLFLGFGPSMMTHSLAHPDLSAQWVVPLIADRVVRLRTPGRSLREGVILGILIAVQVFVGEELLFLATLAIAFYIFAYVFQSPAAAAKVAPSFLRGAGVAVLTAGVLLAYPLSYQFFGPQSFKGIPFGADYYAVDLKTYSMYSSLSLWGDPDKTSPIVPGNAEQAALFGWALLLLVGAFAVLYIRSVVVRSSLVSITLLVLLSLGPSSRFNKKPLPSPFGPRGIWDFLEKLPLFSSSLPMRSAIAVGWLVGVLLAIGLDRAVFSKHNTLRGVAFGLTFCALVPLTPRVLRVDDRGAVPVFFTDGGWRSCMPLGHTIVGVPLSSGGDRTNMVWQTAAGDKFDIPQGPVMTPQSSTDKQVVWARINVLWTAQWLSYINDNGGASTPPITQQIKDQVAGDLRTWHAGCVVVADDNPRLADLKVFLDGALGPGTEQGGVNVWRRTD